MTKNNPVSIPNGSIKSITDTPHNQPAGTFQFQMVRLKATILPRLPALETSFNSKWFD